MLDLGILGGGQLARMMIYRSAPLGKSIAVLDPDSNCSAASLTPWRVQGALKDPQAIRQLSRQCRVLTYDIEHLDVTTLLRLEEEGVPIRPSPRVLQVVQDKLQQRRHLQKAGIPQPGFGEGMPERRPLVVKTRTGGYDGRGVQILSSFQDVPNLAGDLYWEEYVETQRELSVLGVADTRGNIVFYPPAEMVFDPQLNICDQVLMPARIDAAQTRTALEIGRAVIESFWDLGLVGVMAVEMFLAVDGRILVNEVAPRPHNSGHVTMEIAHPCQFEAHVRAVLGLEVPEPWIHGAGWMRNLLGQGFGRPVLVGGDLLDDPRIRVHLYAKPECRPGRKMGHLTAVAATPEDALSFRSLLENVRVEGQPQS